MNRTAIDEPLTLDVEQLLRDALAPTSNDELAYLMLTSKSELPLRDRVAWRLCADAAAVAPDRVVAREWNDVDIAILDRDVPRAFLEFKCIFSADATSAHSNRDKCTDAIAVDVTKRDTLRRSADARIRTWGVVAIVHPVKHLSPTHAATKKYAALVNSALDRCGGEANVWTECCQHLTDRLASYAPRRLDFDRMGFVYGWPVALRWFLLGPLNQEGRPA